MKLIAAILSLYLVGVSSSAICRDKLTDCDLDCPCTQTNTGQCRPFEKYMCICRPGTVPTAGCAVSDLGGDACPCFGVKKCYLPTYPNDPGLGGLCFKKDNCLLLGATAKDCTPVLLYATGTWVDDRIHILDANLESIRSFSTGSNNPNGVATDGDIIYSGHFSTREVVAYDLDGVEQFRWSANTIGTLQGMDLVEDELAIFTHGGTIQFFQPQTGVFIRAIPASDPFVVEGLAYDGEVLWQLITNRIVGVNPANGAIVSSLPNAASGCLFGGTGITSTGPDELLLACTNGDWYFVSSLDGSVKSSGNNGLNMYGLKIIH